MRVTPSRTRVAVTQRRTAHCLSIHKTPPMRTLTTNANFADKKQDCITATINRFCFSNP